jgi:hypothetical protein
MMNRREFLRRTRQTAAVAGATLMSPRFAVAAASPKVLDVEPGPQLFLDDYIIESMEGLTRRLIPPERLPQPVLDSKTFRTTQPYMTVVRDDDADGYRIWYKRLRDLARRIAGWNSVAQPALGVQGAALLWREPGR